MKAISVATMRDLDARTIAAGTPGCVLMERAGTGAVDELLRFVRTRLDPWHCRHLLVVTGKGNNGGDGFVVARALSNARRMPVTVCAVAPIASLSGDARAHADLLPADVEVVPGRDGVPEELLTPGTLVVDALLGTGVTGPLRAPFDRIVNQLNDTPLPVVALDIPSGMDGDTGQGDPVLRADLTVTMAFPKTGMLTPEGLARCGAVRCVPIGVPQAFADAAEATGNAILEQDARALLGRRPANSHKGTFGHVLVVGGSKQYGGAPFLAAEGALRAGAGLVTVATPEHAMPFQPRLRSLIVTRIPDGGRGAFTTKTISNLTKLARTRDAIVVGPGIGRECDGRDLLQAMLALEQPLVIDADALREVAANPDLLEPAAPTVLTPHPGEMADLLKGVGLEQACTGTRREQAAMLARTTGCWVVLKGMGTIITGPDRPPCVNTSGNPGLATAGTGDVLAGVLAGTLTQGYAVADALRLGTYLHGRAAEALSYATRAMTADDVAAALGTAFRECTPFA